MTQPTTLPHHRKAASLSASPNLSVSSREPSPNRSRSPSAPTIPEDVAVSGTSPPSSYQLSSSELNANGVKQPTPQKPGLTKRLTRMFSQNGRLGPPEKDGHREGDASDSSINGGNGTETSTKPPSKPPSRSPSRKGADASRNASEASTKPPSRSPSRKGGEAPRKTSIISIRREGKETPEPSRRFEILSDGTHEHHLKSARRQEKLSGMLRDMLGGKKRDEHGEEQHLSLMSTWVDQLKNERDKLATDKKGGPNSTATLVEKYGKCQEIVGRGAFGIVRISHKPDPKEKTEQLYAVKEFRRRPNESAKKYQKRLTSEFCISSSLRHPNVIHTLDLLQDAKGDYVSVMELCQGGDLYTLVLAAGKLETAEADCYFKQMMRGVEYIHEMGVAHRDLKPENLLLTNRGSLRLSDFGNAECFRMAWETEPHMTAGLCGSAPYIAPEEYSEKEFDPRAVDVWACGVIYMAMRTGRHLWRVANREEDEFYTRYLQGRKDEGGYQPIETLHRARCRNVIYSILDPNPRRRITASQVLKSEWGQEIKLCKAGEEGM